MNSDLAPDLPHNPSLRLAEEPTSPTAGMLAGVSDPPAPRTLQDTLNVFVDAVASIAATYKARHEAEERSTREHFDLQRKALDADAASRQGQRANEEKMIGAVDRVTSKIDPPEDWKS